MGATSVGKITFAKLNKKAEGAWLRLVGLDILRTGNEAEITQAERMRTAIVQPYDCDE